jgi:hypothetical protein
MMLTILTVSLLLRSRSQSRSLVVGPDGAGCTVIDEQPAPSVEIGLVSGLQGVVGRTTFFKLRSYV